MKARVVRPGGGSQLVLLSMTLLLPVTPHPRPEPLSVGLLRLRLRLRSSSSPSEGAWPGEGAELQKRARADGGQDAGGVAAEALTSILGGLQSVSREKGGFGFRFGRNPRRRGRGGP
ncbi:uncharacterized protein qrfp [Festucalex cinctus]